MPDPRLMTDASLTPGAEIALDAEQTHKLATVLRLKPGASVRAFNSRDGEWRCELLRADKRGGALAIREQVRAPTPSPDVDLLFAPVKRHATDLIIEKATELGVRGLQPVITKRTIVDTVRLDRLALIAREAAEQTERFDAPAVSAALPLGRVLDGWDPARTLIYADERGDAPDAQWGGDKGRAAPIADVVAALSPGQPLALLIGPEGGFDPAERQLLRSLAFVAAVSLGPRILRAETATIAALSVIQAMWGDWRG
ncbi:MAG: 16S rRNA (uracil(1498)-N(3))-methyltransferase [Alphaproteobacteria bacterium]|nr:16S rRNA (uracil(1498)-N(3))-methyltransferase [Alphaproteobacteria bacterium]